jgi:5-methylcytosine-specific restriction endonuclease McrA
MAGNVATEPRCDQWMPIAKESCYRTAGHGDGHLTKAACKRKYDSHRKYVKTEAGALAQAQGNARYRQTEAGKAGTRRYFTSAKGKAKRAEYVASGAAAVASARYRATDKGQAFKAKLAEREKTDEVKAVRRAYAQSEAGKASAARCNRRRREAEINCPIDYIEIPDESCYLCGATERLEWDHVVPITLARKYADEHGVVASALLRACRSCNASKNNRDPIEFFGELPVSYLEVRLSA